MAGVESTVRLYWPRPLVLAPVVIALAAVGFQVLAESRWQRLQEAAGRLQERLDAADQHRPVLHGIASDEAAWPHYRTAAGQMASLGFAPGEVARAVHEQARSQDTEPLLILERARPALETLRLGAQAQDARPGMDWSRGFNHPVNNLLHMRDLANVAVLQACLAVKGGQGEEAARPLLDALQLGRDLMQSPLLIDEMIGCALLGVVSDALVREGDPLLPLLDSSAMTVLASGLRILDENLPLSSQGLAGETVMLVRHMQAHSWDWDIFDGSLLTAWRYGFTLKLAVSNHGLSTLEVADQLRSLTSGKDRVDRQALEQVFEELPTTCNPISLLILPNLGATTKARLQAVARIRLLRMAVQHQRGEPVRLLPDPAGGNLHARRIHAGALTFASDQDERLGFTLPG